MINLLIFKNFFFFRFKQFQRFSAALGDNSVAVFTIQFLAFLSIYVFLIRAKTSVSYPVIGATLLAIHFRRSDLNFLLSKKKIGIAIVSIEYFTILLLFLPPIFYTHGIDDYLLYFIFFLLISILSSKYLVYNVGIFKKISSYLPIYSNEWKFGIRRNIFLFSVSYMLSLVILPFLSVFPIFAFYWTTFIGDFYSDFENKEMLQPFQNSSQFLHVKISSLLKTINITFFPQAVLSILYYHTIADLIILIGCMIILNLNGVYYLVVKYANYDPWKNSKSTILELIIFFVICPFLPLSLFIIRTKYLKAKWNLQKLLN